MRHSAKRIERRFRALQFVVGTVAFLFGVATLLAGGRVLGGADPGYIVFRPLLIYNTSMGVVYLLTGIMVWRRIAWGRVLSAGIFVLNLAMLAAIFLLYRSGEAVALDSLRAMTLRTVVWLALFLATSWLARSRTVA